MSDGTLEGFYEWAKRLGHYSASEAVERYRKMVLAEEGKDMKKKVHDFREDKDVT